MKKNVYSDYSWQTAFYEAIEKGKSLLLLFVKYALLGFADWKFFDFTGDALSTEFIIKNCAKDLKILKGEPLRIAATKGNFLCRNIFFFFRWKIQFKL